MDEQEKLKRLEFYMDRYRGHMLSYELNDTRIKKHLDILQKDQNVAKLNTEVSI